MYSQASWSDDDINTLIAFLITKSASAGDSITFKGTVWTKAATAVNKILPMKGGGKTAGSCKSKWGKGADIDETTAEAWAAYEKKHKGSALFCNKGWPWYEKVQPSAPHAKYPL
ncbi:hypothetical protein B0H34DRAFT_794169 [Crassisporium funariophilum]|nr:hypothetical protein B0H34DRAFT_794169 [Crassisporium funariophilum]